MNVPPRDICVRSAHLAAAVVPSSPIWPHLVISCAAIIPNNDARGCEEEAGEEPEALGLVTDTRAGEVHGSDSLGIIGRNVGGDDQLGDEQSHHVPRSCCQEIHRAVSRLYFQPGIGEDCKMVNVVKWYIR